MAQNTDKGNLVPGKTKTQANEKAPRPCWTQGSSKYGNQWDIQLDGAYAASATTPDMAERIVAALNAQAPPPAEPPTPTAGMSVDELLAELRILLTAKKAAAPPPQPGTVTPEALRKLLEAGNALADQIAAHKLPSMYEALTLWREWANAVESCAAAPPSDAPEGEK